MDRFAPVCAAALSPLLESPITGSDLETPPDPKMGDFGFPCFRLSKALRKSPNDVAKDFASKLADNADLRTRQITVAPVGPYVNFTVKPNVLVDALLKDILAGAANGEYGKITGTSRGNWVIEFSSPNIAKPLNIYHLRPTALGATLDRIGRFRGFRITSINHLGDWGKQYGMLTVALKRLNSKPEATLTMKDLVDLYVQINQLAESDPTIEDEARSAFARLEKDDPEIVRIWKLCVDVSMKEFNATYERLGVHFDHVWGESFYKDQLAPLIARLKASGTLVESEGAWVVPVTDREGKELPPCIIQKKDGATIYATRDLAAALYRHEKLQFDRMTYIVGQEQKLHFQQVFGVLRAMKQDWESRCEHVPFGLYRFKDAKMSTRKGNYVTLNEVLELARVRVRELIDARAAAAEDGSSARALVADPLELERTVEAVAIGAVVFHDLHTDPARDVEFDVNRVVDFEGETGPYLQYAHTRCLSILRKADDSGQTFRGGWDAKLAAHLTREEEHLLLKTLGQFPMQLERTLKFAKASHLAHYLVDITKAFGLFYRECRVLGEAPELTQARLALVEATRRVLSQGLGLLGIPLPERM